MILLHRAIGTLNLIYKKKEKKKKKKKNERKRNNVQKLKFIGLNEQKTLTTSNEVDGPKDS